MKQKTKCPFLEKDKYCVHKALAPCKKSHHNLCPYLSNHKRCDLWKASSTNIKDGLELPTELKRENE